MNYSGLSPLEIYRNRVFKLIIIGIPCIGICAGLTFSLLKMLGYYPDVSVVSILIFDAVNVSYVVTGLYFYSNCEDRDGNIKLDFLKKGKVLILFIILVQWNLISVLIPSRDFWAYAPFFVLLSAVFLDRRYVSISILEIAVSILVTWTLFPEKLLPVRDELFFPEIALRLVLLFFGLGTIWAITLLIEKGLVNELEKIADFDTLTLLYNRRKFETQLNHALSQEAKPGQPFSVIMLDIDDFKAVNDTYGHRCGDEVLKEMANILRGIVGKRGLIFRYGGEEILVLLYADAEESINTAEAIRRKVDLHETHFDGNAIHVTVTLGVAIYTAGDSGESLIQRSDANLYYGKSHGKNCVIVRKPD